MVLAVWPIIRNCLGYSDQRLVEFACLCVIRVIDSYHRASTENLENLLDETAIRAINLLLMPSGGSPLIAANTYTLLLKALATAARASPRITVTLLQADIVDTLYQILTGVLPSASVETLGGGQGLGGDVTHMTVMENLAHRSKDQVEEALSLISELMPPLPRGSYFHIFTERGAYTLPDGVFDHKGYTDKALARMVKARAKADRAASRQAAVAASHPFTDPIMSPDTLHNLVGHHDSTQESDAQAQEADEAMLPISGAEPPSDRTELLRSKPEVVGRFMQLMVPILVDVYAASVITPIRVKTLTGLLKAVGFLEGVELKTALHVSAFIYTLVTRPDDFLSRSPSPASRRQSSHREITLL